MRQFGLFLAAACIAVLATPQFFAGTEPLALIGAAAAQEAVDVDYFYDQLEPFGPWVWHPRFGYVWIPANVSENWRPYTVGHWVYTDEYGWYWQSEEPFAWAVYHYGRWGYDRDYGWFWVPGDTWSPAWVRWRYSDQYVGWAPVGPADGGYAYGAAVSYEPPVAEAWVFVEPRYVASPLVDQYYVPIPRLNAVFLNATTVYHPEFRDGVVFNVGIPRETVVKITNRPISVEKIVRVQNQTNLYEKGGEGIRVFAPPVAGGKPDGMPKHFVDSPSEFRPKAKLTATVEGTPAKGFGPTAATIRPIASVVRPEEFKKHVLVGASPGPTGAGPTQGQTPTSPSGQGQASTEGGPGGPSNNKKKAGPGASGPGPGQANIQGGPGGPAGQGEHKSRVGPGGPGGPGQPSGPSPGQANIQGGPGGGKARGKPAVCNQNPDLPVCKEKQ
jgi:hypothetical protein